MKSLIAGLIFFLVIIPFVSANVQFVPLPYKNTLSPSKISGTVDINFEVKDSNGNPLQNALITIQGISNQGFNQNLFTDENGKVSTSLANNEIFVYTTYKFTYELLTNVFFTNSNKNIEVILNKIPNNKWYFYYENNGEIEVQFKSLDNDTVYVPGEYINQVLQIKNVLGRNFDLVKNKTLAVTVDGKTLNKLNWWGSILPYDSLLQLTLKPNGWVKASIKGDIFEVCVGNAIGKYKDQSFDVSGSEFICEQENNAKAPPNLVPDWILNNTYKLDINIAYTLDNQEKNFKLLTQDFFIKNTEWKPKINSVPKINLNINEDWFYDIIPKYKLNFILYSLLEFPSGMTVDSLAGVVKWKPAKSGVYNVTLRESHLYFVNDSRMAYRDQSFVLNVKNPNANLYADGLYLFNKNVKTGDSVRVKFIVHNNDDKINSFSYKIEKGDGNSIEYNLSNLSSDSNRTVYTSWNYSTEGLFTPKLIVDPQNKIYEKDENDNIKNFEGVNVTN